MLRCKYIYSGVSMNKVPVAISNRHIFLSEEDTIRLFNTLNVPRQKTLGQEKYYAYEPTVDVIGQNNYVIKNVRVIGPPRKKTQVELLFGDCVKLDIKPYIRQTEDIKGSPGCVLKSKYGQAQLNTGVIVPARHMHANYEDAEKMGLIQNEFVKIRAAGDRALIFDNVLVRIDKYASLAFHIDIEEANAANVKPGQMLQILK